MGWVHHVLDEARLRGGCDRFVSFIDRLIDGGRGRRIELCWSTEGGEGGIKEGRQQRRKGWKFERGRSMEVEAVYAVALRE